MHRTIVRRPPTNNCRCHRRAYEVRCATVAGCVSSAQLVYDDGDYAFHPAIVEFAPLRLPDRSIRFDSMDHRPLYMEELPDFLISHAARESSLDPLELISA